MAYLAPERVSLLALPLGPAGISLLGPSLLYVKSKSARRIRGISVQMNVRKAQDSRSAEHSQIAAKIARATKRHIFTRVKYRRLQMFALEGVSGGERQKYEANYQIFFNNANCCKLGQFFFHFCQAFGGAMAPLAPPPLEPPMEL